VRKNVSQIIFTGIERNHTHHTLLFSQHVYHCRGRIGVTVRGNLLD
jgi:hypothetical protein